MSPLVATETERLRIAATADDQARSRSDPAAVAGAPTLVAQTTTVKTYPAAAQSYFACLPANVLGTETEGTAGTVKPATGVFYALNLGTVIPPTGTTIITTFAGNRWVFRYDG